MGGLVGIALAIIVTAGLSLLIVAGRLRLALKRAPKPRSTARPSLSSFELIPDPGGARRQRPSG